jgi:hypothetical protein
MQLLQRPEVLVESSQGATLQVAATALTQPLLLIFPTGARGPGSWFKMLGRQQQSGSPANSGAASGITSSSQPAAADGASSSSSRGEQRSGMMQLLTGGTRSDEQGGSRTGLLSSLVQNK